MTRVKRAEPHLTPGPAQDLVDLFKRLRYSSQLRIGQIANRTGYAPSHISEVLRGWKAPSPDAAVKIAQVLGGDDSAVRRARRHAEDLMEWKRNNSRRLPRTPPESSLTPLVEALVGALHEAGVSASRNKSQPDLAKFPLHHQMSSPDVALNIILGDLFDQETHLAVGFSDTFDTFDRGRPHYPWL